MCRSSAWRGAPSPPVQGVRLERAEPTEPTELVFPGSEDRTYVMLRVAEASRALDIQIGSAEAFAISSALEGKRWDRPMTHDLLGEVIAALGATLRQVVITEYRRGWRIHRRDRP